MTGSPDSLAICLFGAGGHGRGIAAQIAQITGVMPVFADGSLPVGTMIGEAHVHFTDLRDVAAHDLLITIGAADVRRKYQVEACALGCRLTTFIADPGQYFSPPPGLGTVVLSGAVVNAETRIGEGVIINNGAIVEHGCYIGDFSHIAPGAVVAGDAHVGADVWIGANATVLQGITIADGTTVGAGAVVTRDISAPGTYIGLPARKVE
ncbi:hypothetical protein G5B38_20110 (plasmid) [Pseudohalocynthiibacter aestuariivivens]|uniref:NeuD/PglB/VioB family sugar acetyltransferase n=1 Tax=Roseovarius pelagicus TaxID=2980108 RepID=A0ABY6D5N1_9RHOB|nr:MULTISPECIES: NeuD/PglB/VioB family sugar acetyltransferase [Rhodobacterales]QIE47920.1 hypothetical protein G5B38_20110 [Pseudohalocynthiibacter aestuariivivens]UXX81413.1 NeuD/PglB/VioB family sugar acetyltransferase [Roseovarius pelagicus]